MRSILSRGPLSLCLALAAGLSALSSLPGCGGDMSAPDDDTAGAARDVAATASEAAALSLSERLPGRGHHPAHRDPWARSFGSPGEPESSVGVDQLADLAVDPAGNVVLGGIFGGTIDFGAGPLTSIPDAYSGFVAKLDDDGHGRWSRKIDGPSGSQWVTEVATNAAGDVFVLATFSSSIDFGAGLHTTSDWYFHWAVAKFNRRGDPLWSRDFNLGSSGTAHLAADGAGNVILGGNFSGTVDLGTGPVTPPQYYTSPYVVQLDPTGNTTWAHTLTEGGVHGEVYSVAASARGDVAVAGWFAGSYDFGCGPLAGPATTYDAGFFVASLDTTGDCHWNVMTEMTQGEIGSDVVIDNRGDVFVTGSFFGTTLYGTATTGMLPFVARFNRAGALRWSNLAVGGSIGSSPTLAVDAAGNVSVAMEAWGPIDFGGGPLTGPTDRWKFAIAQFNTAGSLRWSTHVGSSLGYVSEPSIGVSRRGELILGGSYSGTLDVSGNTLVGDSGAQDVFVAELTH